MDNFIFISRFIIYIRGIISNLLKDYPITKNNTKSKV